MNTDPWWWHLSRQVTDVLDWLDETETGTNSNGYRNRDFEIDILTSHLVYHMICQNSSKFNLLLINLIKNLIIPWKYTYIQISIDHMAGFMCHGILKCVNFDAEIGLLTGKDFRFRSFPAIWSALFGSDFYCQLNISRNQGCQF